VIEKTALIGASDILLKRAEKILKEVSLGLTITAIDVTMTLHTGAPVWCIVYMAKGILLGEENYIPQLTGFANPKISDEVLKTELTEGCRMLRDARAKQGNGLVK
jgi:hypothetical protein